MLSNINACSSIASILSTTLGPRGSDKLIVPSGNTRACVMHFHLIFWPSLHEIYLKSQATITNDGATILKLLDVVHPAAKLLVDVARSQDAEVGDGTTSCVLIAAELLKECMGFLEDGVASGVVMKGYRRACQLVSRKY